MGLGKPSHLAGRSLPPRWEVPAAAQPLPWSACPPAAGFIFRQIGGSVASRGAPGSSKIKMQINPLTPPGASRHPPPPPPPCTRSFEF